MLATLFLAQGTPMLLAGDELGRTQRGNNNAYCQDNEITWIDWEAIDDDGRALLAFTRKLIALRNALPVLRRNRFFTGVHNDQLGVKDVTWLSPTGEEMTEQQWTDPHARCLGIMLDGRAQTSGIKRRGSDATVLIVVNSHDGVVPFTLPEVAGGEGWELLIDSNSPDMLEMQPFEFGHPYDVAGRSLLLFARESGESAGGVRNARDASSAADSSLPTSDF
jgi:glycogen operon protein